MSPLAGRYEERTGRPFVEARVVLPRVNLGFDASFLVDTAADGTVLMPDDGIRTGLDYNGLSGFRPVGGMAGDVEAAVESALLLFSIPGERLYLYRIELLVFPAAPDLLGTPSLLGRDVLDRWRTTYSPSEGVLQFEVLSSDHEVDRSRSYGRSRRASGVP